MQALRADHVVALDVLFARHWPELVAYARSFLHCRDAAEDIAQETFMRLWRGRSFWRPTGAVRCFLFCIARNLALEQLRACRVQQRAVPEVQRRGNAGPTPLEETIRAEVRVAFRDALDALPDRRRQAFTLVRLNCLSLMDSAKIMGISPQTVANHINMAVADLRSLLDVHSPCGTH